MKLALDLSLSSRAALAAAGNTLLAYPQSYAQVGDSIPWAQSGTRSNSICQIGQWLNGFSGGRTKLIEDYNKGVGGETTAQYAARYTSALSPLNAKIVLIGTSINGIANSVSAASELASIDSIIAQGAALGHYQIFIPPLPTSSLTGPQETVRQAVVAGIAARTSKFVRPIDITGYNMLTMHYAQQGSGVRIHPNIVGAQWLGQKAADIAATIVQAGSGLLTASNPLNKAGNGYMTGTGGNLSGLGTGQLADGCSLATNSAKGNITIACSKVARSAGGFWQQIQIGGSYIFGSNDVNLTIANNLSGGGFVSGDKYAVTFDMEIDAGAININGVNVFVLLFASDFSASVTCQAFYVNTTEHQGGYGVPQSKFIVQLDPFALPAGKTPGVMNIFLTPNIDQDAGPNAPCALTFRVGSVGVAKYA